MKKTVTERSLILATAALGLSLSVVGARANSIYELGTVKSGSPASPANETSYLTELINAYDGGMTGILPVSFTGDSALTYTLIPGSYVPDSSLPSVTQNEGQVTGGGGQTSNLGINLGTGGYAYAVVKWGNVDEYYYIAGLTGQLTLGNDVNHNAESHYDLFKGGPMPTDVGAPDVASTAGLLSLGVAGLGFLRRKIAR